MRRPAVCNNDTGVCDCQGTHFRDDCRYTKCAGQRPDGKYCSGAGECDFLKGDCVCDKVRRPCRT